MGEVSTTAGGNWAFAILLLLISGEQRKKLKVQIRQLSISGISLRKFLAEIILFSLIILLKESSNYSQFLFAEDHVCPDKSYPTHCCAAF